MRKGRYSIPMDGLETFFFPYDGDTHDGGVGDHQMGVLQMMISIIQYSIFALGITTINGLAFIDVFYRGVRGRKKDILRTASSSSLWGHFKMVSECRR